MADVMNSLPARRATLLGAACLLLTGCGQSEEREVKSIKSQVQDRYGAKDFAKGYELALKGLELSRKTFGDKHADTIYFAVGVTQNAMGMRNFRAAQKALRTELELRTAAGQSEEKMQPRRTLLIKLAEEGGDKTTAIAQTVLIAKALGMGPGKDPQPTYKPDGSPYPMELLKSKTEGDVELGFNLDATGTPVAVRVMHATPPNVFDNAAIEHLKKWRFTPYIDHGEPVSSAGHHFTLGFRMPR